ncbi:unnamed protein product, partial [Thlaspi arvense]
KESNDRKDITTLRHSHRGFSPSFSSLLRTVRSNIDRENKTSEARIQKQGNRRNVIVVQIKTNVKRSYSKRGPQAKPDPRKKPRKPPIQAPCMSPIYPS